MTQRIFDIENEKDMADLWAILPDEAYSIKKSMGCQTWRRKGEDTGYYFEFVKINWHDETEIIRPIQEATHDDVGRICMFWDMGGCYYGVLTNVGDYSFKYQMNNNSTWQHCRRLTEQEIEELC